MEQEQKLQNEIGGPQGPEDNDSILKYLPSENKNRQILKYGSEYLSQEESKV